MSYKKPILKKSSHKPAFSWKGNKTSKNNNAIVVELDDNNKKVVSFQDTPLTKKLSLLKFPRIKTKVFNEMERQQYGTHHVKGARTNMYKSNQIPSDVIKTIQSFLPPDEGLSKAQKAYIEYKLNPTTKELESVRDDLNLVDEFGRKMPIWRVRDLWEQGKIGAL